MGSVLPKSISITKPTSKSKPPQSMKKKAKKAWWQNKSTRASICLAVTLVIFVIIFVASLEIRMKAPVIIMSSHDYPNIVVFNANTGAFITTELLDLSYQKGLDLATYVKENQIQFRGMVSNDGKIVITNGHHNAPFIASFICNKSSSGWKLKSFFPQQNRSDYKYIGHPYGLTWHSKNKWWIFTTQDTSSLFIYDEHGYPITNLTGMKQHFPGAVFTIINQTNGTFLDTFIPNDKSFFDETSMKKKGFKIKIISYGIRGVAVDIEYGLIFVAIEILEKYWYMILIIIFEIYII